MHGRRGAAHRQPEFGQHAARTEHSAIEGNGSAARRGSFALANYPAAVVRGIAACHLRRRVRARPERLVQRSFTSIIRQAAVFGEFLFRGETAPGRDCARHYPSLLRAGDDAL